MLVCAVMGQFCRVVVVFERRLLPLLLIRLSLKPWVSFFLIENREVAALDLTSTQAALICVVDVADVSVNLLMAIFLHLGVAQGGPVLRLSVVHLHLELAAVASRTIKLVIDRNLSVVLLSHLLPLEFFVDHLLAHVHLLPIICMVRRFIFLTGYGHRLLPGEFMTVAVAVGLLVLLFVVLVGVVDVEATQGT